MQWQALYIILIIIAVFVMIMLLFYAVRQRFISSAWYFAGSMLPAIFWMLNVGVLALSPPESAVLWLNIKYFWISVQPVTLLLFFLNYTNTNVQLKIWHLASLLIIPLTTQIMVWTNDFHHLMLQHIQFTQVGILTYIPTITFGPYYWIHTTYSYFLVLLSIVLVVNAMRRGSYLYRRQGLLLITGILMPLIGNILLIANIAPREIDPMPFALLTSGLSLSWSVFRYHMLDLAPIARSIFVDAIPDGMLAINNQGRVLDINKPMLEIIGAPQKRIIGTSVREILKPWQDLVHHFRDETQIETEISIGSRQYALLIMPITDRQANIRGRLITLHDITQRKQLEEEREKLIMTLQHALSEVKKLSGLLPICAHCKKIRDDQGYWHQVDAYIHNHSEAEFSHGICPECIAKLYSDV